MEDLDDAATRVHGGGAQPGFEEIALGDGECRLGEVVAEWREFVGRVEGSSYFQTPEWVLSWWEDRGRPPTVVGLWRDTSGRLEAVAFLTRLREPLWRRLPLAVSVVTNSGSGRPHSADRCGWPVLSHRVDDVREWAATHRWNGSLLLRHLDPRIGERCAPPGARLVLTTRGPVLESAGDGTVAPSSKKLAKDLPRLRRRLERIGVTFAWTPPEQMTADSLDLLFDLHASSRTGRSSSSFTPERHADFQRRLIKASRPGCGPAMAVASLQGRRIGIEYGFVWRDTFYGYQGGWDAAYAKLRVGTVLIAETIRLAQLNGCRTIDFMRGTEPYKYSFGATDVVDETWLVPRGPSGLLLKHKYRLARADQTKDAQHTTATSSRRTSTERNNSQYGPSLTCPQP